MTSPHRPRGHGSWATRFGPRDTTDGGSKTDLAELGRKLGFTQPELNDLEAARRSVESSRSGNLQTVQSSDPRERPDDLPLTDDADTPVPYDFRNDQLYMIGEWSPVRRLHRTQVRTQFVPMHERPPQAWVDESLWKTTVASRKNDSGDLAYITAFKIDHQESDETQFCHVTYAESRYAEVRALEQLRIDQPALLQRADNALRANARHYLANALPSSLAVNVVVVSADEELLCLRRSAAVDNAVGLWTVGIFETLKLSDVLRGGESDTLFHLAERGLREELHLFQGDYDEVQLTWLGIYRPIFRGHLVALVRVELPKAEIEDRLRRAHSSYEHDGVEWLPLSKATLDGLIDGGLHSTPGEAGATADYLGRAWLEQSRLAVFEAWRWRSSFLARNG